MKPVTSNRKKVIGRAIRGGLIGWLIGLFFPVLSIYLLVAFKGLTLTRPTLFQLQRENPLLWVIYLTPLVLAIAGWLVEANRARLDLLTEELDERVAERSSEINLQKKYFETLVNESPVAIVTLDHQHRIIDCNPAFENLFGYALEEIYNSNLDDILTDSETRLEAEALTRQIQDGKTIRSTGIRLGKNGKRVEVEIFGAPVIVGEHQNGVLGLYNDITERRKALNALTDSEKNFRTLASSTIAAILIIQDGVLKFMNPAAEYLLGYSSAELVDRQDYLSILTKESRQLYDIFTQEQEHVKTTPSRFESTIVTRSGQIRWMDISRARIRYNGQPALLMTFFDITDRKESEVNLKFMATHDPLTGLPNRVLFQDRLTHALAFARRSLKRVAVMFVDLDGFKQINDRFGHERGDQILRELGLRMQNCIRTSDTVARLGGDEFTFILEEIDTIDNAILIADKVLVAIRQPFEQAGQSDSISASIGISLYPDDCDNAEELVKLADGLMYRAKRAGKNRYQLVSHQDIFPDQSGEQE